MQRAQEAENVTSISKHRSPENPPDCLTVVFHRRIVPFRSVLFHFVPFWNLPPANSGVASAKSDRNFRHQVNRGAQKVTPTSRRDDPRGEAVRRQDERSLAIRSGLRRRRTNPAARLHGVYSVEETVRSIETGLKTLAQQSTCKAVASGSQIRFPDGSRVGHVEIVPSRTPRRLRSPRRDPDLCAETLGRRRTEPFFTPTNVFGEHETVIEEGVPTCCRCRWFDCSAFQFWPRPRLRPSVTGSCGGIGSNNKKMGGATATNRLQSWRFEAEAEGLIATAQSQSSKSERSAKPRSSAWSSRESASVGKTSFVIVPAWSARFRGKNSRP